MSRAQWVALVFTAAIAAVVMWYSNRAPLSGGMGSVTTRNYAEPLDTEQRLRANLSMGAGVLRIRSIESANIYEATIRHSLGIPVTVHYARRDGQGDLDIADRGFRFLGREYTNEWIVGLTRRVPVDLRASTGAGRGFFDLTGMTGSVEISAGAGEVRLEFGEGPAALKELELRAGAGRFEAIGLANAHARRIEASAGIGEMHLDFSGAARATTEVKIRGGVGRIVLVIPPEVGARIRVERGLTSRFNLRGFTQRGEDEYVNGAWETAAARLDIEASLGVGEFEVRGG